MVEAATMMSEGLRRGPVEGQAETINGISLLTADPAFRMSLRARTDAVAAVSLALGLELPQRPKHSVSANRRTAMWLGPDEWLVIDENQRDPILDLKDTAVLHSAVDISHRNIAILVSGDRAADVINAGCPQDLSLTAFPVGGCSRTVMGKIEIVLLRTGPDQFRVECWRSFAKYAFSYLKDAAKGI